MSPPRRPLRTFAVLSGLLLITGLALAGATLARLPGLMAGWQGLVTAPTTPASGSPDPSPLSAIEPGNGPAPTAPAPPPAMAAAPPAAPADDGDPATVAALEALSAELGRYQAALAEREQRLTLREAVMAATEARIGEQLARQSALKGELERLTGQLAAEDQTKIAQLVKVYEAMKAKNAATIFDPMALDLLLPIVRGMRETKVAAIVAEMDPAKARALTAELARKGDAPAP